MEPCKPDRAENLHGSKGIPAIFSSAHTVHVAPKRLATFPILRCQSSRAATETERTRTATSRIQSERSTFKLPDWIVGNQK